MDSKIKKGQVTIFIIIGILVVAIILLFLFLSNRGQKSDIFPEKNPSSFLKSCLDESILSTIDFISSQGGYIEPKLYKDFVFTGEKSSRISYLCYTALNTIPCINQEPLLLKHFNEEIKSAISPDVQECWDSLGRSLQEQGYVVEGTNEGFDVNIEESSVNIKIKNKFTLTKSNQSSQIGSINLVFPSNIYERLMIVQEIISQEVLNCDFDVVEAIDTYPQFEIEKTKTLDGAKIYTLIDSQENKFRFAVRGCVNEPGY